MDDFENLLKKVGVISKLLQVSQNDNKQLQERVSNLEITCEFLKKNDVVLKEYSICYPDTEEEVEVKESTRTEAEIKTIETAKKENACEIIILEQRIQKLESEHDSLQAKSDMNKNIGSKNTGDIEELKEKGLHISSKI